MTRSQILSACAIEFARFRAESGVAPEDWTLENTMLWEIAFVAGASWWNEETLKRAIAQLEKTTTDPVERADHAAALLRERQK